MADTLKLTPHQASDAEAMSEAVYSMAADAAIEPQTLGRDIVALVAILLVVVTYHIQNPLLQFGVTFGTAFRNVTLQPILALTLLGCALILGGSRQKLRENPVRLVAFAVLLTYALYIVAAIVLRFNVLGLLLGIPQEMFLAEVEEGAPLDALQAAISISTLFEYMALLSVVLLWAPWQRVEVYAKALRRYSASLVIAVIVLVVWEVLIIGLGIQQFLLPRPSVIGAKFADIYPALVTVSWNTFQNAFWGFVVGCGAGILTGLVSARFIGFSRALLPLAIAANSVPIVAFAPIFNTWFGALNPASKIAIVAVLTYFPAMISTVKGLTSIDNLSLELMDSYAAGQWDIFRKLRLPTALPFIFSALKVSTTLSMIGAIVSEYFGGSTLGLGYRIREDAALFKYPESWAAIIMASLLGILFYVLVSAVERAVMPWHVSFRDD
jgi:NitT/TauT family transport system permease protein